MSLALVRLSDANANSSADSDSIRLFSSGPIESQRGRKNGEH